MATIRSPFCGYNVAKCVESTGEDLSRVIQIKFNLLVNKNVRMIINLPTKKAYFSDITVENIYQSLPTRWRRKPAGIEITSLSPYVYRRARGFVAVRRISGVVT